MRRSPSSKSAFLCSIILFASFVLIVGLQSDTSYRMLSVRAYVGQNSTVTIIETITTTLISTQNINGSETNSTATLITPQNVSSSQTNTTNTSISSQNTNASQTNATTSFSSSSYIPITFDLPTAAVVTFVFVLLGLTVGFLLIARTREMQDST